MSSAKSEWKKTWQGDLSARSWQKFDLASQNFLLKTHVDHREGYEFLLTDLTCMWHEKMDIDEVKKRCKTLNPRFEAPLPTILRLLQDNTETKKDSTDYTIQHAGEGLVLVLETKVGGIRFTWEFHCQQAQKEMLRDQLLEPLMTMVGELGRRELRLGQLLKAKDREIEDYKMGGATVSRKNLLTEPFDPTSFHKQQLISKEFDEQVGQGWQEAFTRETQDLYKEVMLTQAWINREEEEDEGSDDDTSLLGGGTTHHAPGATKGSPSRFEQRSPNVSPRKRPAGTPLKGEGAVSTPEKSQKDIELMRREALQKRLQEEAQRKQAKKKKKGALF
ncbi:NHEJ1 [Branchiostoma lanceolatum]|uniref:Non-homologous end-joining factor 1 n=1 Tax=Branchiostoma lanceolatum TaxID=7740 RepID=A0A8K0E5J5_BRALA|nr:NHEJ1 [Branchiostoma lanceolatum]